VASLPNLIMYNLDSQSAVQPADPPSTASVSERRHAISAQATSGVASANQPVSLEPHVSAPTPAAAVSSDRPAAMDIQTSDSATIATRLSERDPTRISSSSDTDSSDNIRAGIPAGLASSASDTNAATATTAAAMITTALPASTAIADTTSVPPQSAPAAAPHPMEVLFSKPKLRSLTTARVPASVAPAPDELLTVSHILFGGGGGDASLRPASAQSNANKRRAPTGSNASGENPLGHAHSSGIIDQTGRSPLKSSEQMVSFRCVILSKEHRDSAGPVSDSSSAASVRNYIR